MKEMLLVKHSLLLVRRHNRSFQLNTDRKLNRERIYLLPVFIFGLTNKGFMVYSLLEVKRKTRKTAKILFALHYIRTGCEINSTN